MEDEETTEASLREDYERSRERVTMKMAEDEEGKSIGFYTRDWPLLPVS